MKRPNFLYQMQGRLNEAFAGDNTWQEFGEVHEDKCKDLYCTINQLKLIKWWWTDLN